MAIYICSDFHGRWETYQKALEIVGDNKLYVLGDCIDRNPGGAAILCDIMKKDKITLLIGNHEWMMYNSLFDDKSYGEVWLTPNNGGRVTLRALHKAVDEGKITFEELHKYLLKCPLYVDFGEIYLCHGYPHFWVDQDENKHPEGTFDKPTTLSLEDAVKAQDLKFIEHMVWDSVFYSPWLVTNLQNARDIPTTVYSGHVIKNYAKYGEETDDGMPMLRTEDNMLTCIDVDGGCAFPENGSYGGYLNLINLNTNQSEQIQIYKTN